MNRQNKLLVLLFVILSGPFGIFLCNIIPLGHGPDENAHIVRADGLLQGHLVGGRRPVALADGRHVEYEGILADPAVYWITTLPVRPLDTAPQHMTADMLAKSHGMS